MRLNMASVMFVITIITESCINPSEMSPPVYAKRIIRPKIKANMRFDAGPAKAVKSSPFLLLVMLYVLISTGFAHPKMIPPAIKVMSGMTMEPNISRCFIGLSVNLP